VTVETAGPLAFGVVRRATLAIAILLLIAAASMAVSGGLRISGGGLRLSARSPVGPLAAGLAAAVVWAGRARRDRALLADLDWWTSAVLSRARVLAILIAFASGAAALACHTYSPSGADASGYLSQAQQWTASARDGVAERIDPLVELPGWKLPAQATSPLGWQPAASPGRQVPTYPPGLPLLMSLPFGVGGVPAASSVVAASAGVAVWAAGAIAMSLWGPAAALVAAATLAASPVFLFQSFQPMSDVPAMAAWLLCWSALLSTGGPRWLLVRCGGAGLAAAAAVIIRPNLAPLALIPFLSCGWSGPTAAGRERRWARIALFAAPVAAAGIGVALLQWRWYGSPLQSGYGAASGLFALANVFPNAVRYARWIWETQPVLFLAPLACLRALNPPPLLGETQSSSGATSRGLNPRGSNVRGSNVRGLNPRGLNPRGLNLRGLNVCGLNVRGLNVRGLNVCALNLFALCVVASYLAYAVFEDWSYLRFLLPGLGIGAVMVGGLGEAGISRLPRPARGLALLALVLAIGAQGLTSARSHDAFGVAERDARARLAGAYLDAALPDRAVVLAGEQSGAVRLMTGLPIVRWDLLAGAQMAEALRVLEANDREVWWVLDQWEEALVRERFADLEAARLDWPPRLEAGVRVRSRAWRLADRAPFVQGEHLTTDRLR
jgi:hypothetical protein